MEREKRGEERRMKIKAIVNEGREIEIMKVKRLKKRNTQR